MAATVTATGVAGPGTAVTAQVFTDIAEVTFDCIDNSLVLKRDDGKVTHISISAADTITATKSGSAFTFTIS